MKHHILYFLKEKPSTWNNMRLKKPGNKATAVFIEELEKSLKVKSIGHTTDMDVLLCIMFPDNCKIPKDFQSIREELEAGGYIIFTSRYKHKSKEVLSFNISKII